MLKKDPGRAGRRQDAGRADQQAAPCLRRGGPAGPPVRHRRNEADISRARECLEPFVREGATVIADRGYDADHLRDWLAGRKAAACIPPRRHRREQRPYDAELYKTRNIIERMFGRLKDWRALALRTFRCLSTFTAAAHIAATVIWCL